MMTFRRLSAVVRIEVARRSYMILLSWQFPSFRCRCVLGVDGTVVNGYGVDAEILHPFLNAGRLETALCFDGKTDRLPGPDLPELAVLDHLPAFTISLIFTD